MRDDADADGLLEERRGHRAERHPGGGLAGAGPLEHRAGLVEAVLLHADQVGVAGTRTGQRGVAGQPLELVRVDRVGGHHLSPTWATRCCRSRWRPGRRACAVPHAAEDRDLVLLERHPRAAAVAEPAARQRVGEVVGGDADAGRHPLEDRHQGGTVGLACSQPSEHGRRRNWGGRAC